MKSIGESGLSNFIAIVKLIISNINRVFEFLGRAFEYIQTMFYLIHHTVPTWVAVFLFASIFVAVIWIVIEVI